eukprot:Skav203027  [mRNA]  locus=scaffold583:358340:359437:+ [translate_table: standard]
MGCGSSAQRYFPAPATVPVAGGSQGPPVTTAAPSARALQFVNAEVNAAPAVPASALAHHAPRGRGPGPVAGAPSSEGPWDKEDLSYGPSFGPEELQAADLLQVKQLPLQPGSYYVGGVLAKTDNCHVHLGASYSDKTKVIVKRVSGESAQPFQTHVNEVRCLLRLQHERIVKLLGVAVSPDNFMDIVLEYCPLGALRNYVAKSEGTKTLLQLLCDVAEALGFMHSQWFAHLDVKPHNILVEQAGPRAKLCDFGTATRIGASGCLCGIMGTPGYRAPEIDERNEFNAYKADVWSLGKVAEFVESSCGKLGVRYQEMLETVPGLRPDMAGCHETFRWRETMCAVQPWFTLIQSHILPQCLTKTGIGR